MLALVLSTHFLFGMFSFAPHPDTIAALEKRGLSTSKADFPKAVDVALDKRDKDLFLNMAKTMQFPPYDNLLADHVIRRYEALPENEFKQSIAVAVAYSLAHVDRVIQSKWACELHGRVLEVLYTQPTRDVCVEADLFLGELSSHCGIKLPLYLIKAALVMPDDQIDCGRFCLNQLKDHWPSVTPAMAYHVYQRYAYRAGVIPNENVFGPIRERAKALLEAIELPPGSSREEVLRELDALIEADGKKLCDKYSKMEYQPALGK